MEEPQVFYRFGCDPETPVVLEDLCEEAVKKGFPHGVSTVTETNRDDACMAVRADLELYFSIVKTGRRRTHYTIVLPHPVEQLDAERLNGAFGRIGS